MQKFNDMRLVSPAKNSFPMGSAPSADISPGISMFGGMTMKVSSPFVSDYLIVICPRSCFMLFSCIGRST